jgi:hypothetical protein
VQQESKLPAISTPKEPCGVDGDLSTLPQEVSEVKPDAGRQDDQVSGVDPTELRTQRGLGFRV